MLLKLLALLGVLAALLAAAAAADPGITRVSVPNLADQATLGTQANSDSVFPAISTDGRFVAFHSLASNLVPADTNGVRDVFVHDRLTGTTERVSVDSAGNEGNGPSGRVNDIDISGDGRFVTFRSEASNLVAGDTNGVPDIFVHDRLTGVTTRVSVSSDGAQAPLGADNPSISANGRFVTFGSSSSNMVASDINRHRDVFVHDRLTGAVTLVSVNSAGLQGDHDSGTGTSISADGRFVAFHSQATNLVSDDTNLCPGFTSQPGACPDLFLHDRDTDEDGIFDELGAVATIRVNLSSDGAQANDQSRDARLSADGRFVAFMSFASNLVAGDTNGTFDIFVHDRLTGITARVSLDSAGNQGNDSSGQFGSPAISADGRFVAFESLASNLVAGDTRGHDIFVRDRDTDEDGVFDEPGAVSTAIVSLDSAGGIANGSSLNPAINADGRVVAFESVASDLVADDTNGVRDVFVHDRGAAVINVTIDIKPGSDPNSIKLGGTGNVPVAIFSTVTFDATSIDVATLQLNSASVRLVGGQKVLASVDDINGDGLVDLVVQFDRGLLDLTVGDGIGTVTGSTLDGQSILGTDSVRVIE